MDYCQDKSVRRFGQVDVCVPANKSLTHADKTVYSVLVSFRNHRTHTAWPSRSLIAKLACLHLDSVSRSCRRLVAAGVLTIERDGRGGHRNTIYSFPLIDPPKPQPVSVQTDRGASSDVPTPTVDEINEFPTPNPSPKSDVVKTVVQDRTQDIVLPSPPSLDFPEAFSTALCCALAHMLTGIPADDAQLLVDELGFNCRAVGVQNPAGYMRKLIALYRSGRFSAEVAHLERQRREHRRRTAAAVEAAKRTDPLARYNSPPGCPPRPDQPVSRANVQGHIAGLRAALKGAPSAPSVY